MAGNRTLKLSLLADSKEFGKGLKDGETRLSKFGGVVKNVGKGVAAGAGIVAGLGVAAFAASTKVAEAGDRIAKGASKLGITTDAYQEMEYWASQNGLSHDQMERAVGRLNQRIGDAADGTGKYAEAFEGLGVRLRDTEGNLRSTEEVMSDTVTSLMNIEEPAERSAAAAEVFGTKMARELMPALEDGSLTMEEAAEKAHELGIVIDEDAVASAERFTDGWDDLKRSAQGMFRDAMIPIMSWFADVFMPLLQNRIIPAVQTFADWIGPKVEKAMEVMSEFITGTLVPAIERLYEWFKDNALPVIRDVRDFIADRLVPAFQNVVSVLAERLQPVFENVWSTIKSVIDGIKSIAMPIIDALRDAWNTVSEALDGGGGATGEGLMTILDKMWSLISTVAGFIAEHVAPVIGELLGGAIRMTADIVAGFVGTIRTAFDWLKRLADRITSVGRAIRDSPIGQLAGGVTSAVGSLFGRAAGGVAAAGRPYIVGERGPELFIPSGSGRVVPSSQTGGGGTVINVTGTMVDPEGVARAVQQAIRRSNGRVGAVR